MMSYICSGGTSVGTIIIYVVLILVLIAMLIMPYFTQKKRNQEFAKMLNAIKVGDLVKTAGGVIGKVTKITDKGEIKTVILETGSKTEKSYMEFDLSMIYCVLKSTKVEKESEVEENKPEAIEATAVTVEEPTKEEAKALEEPKAEEAVEAKVEAEEKKPKTTAKKKTASKSAKKTTKK